MANLGDYPVLEPLSFDKPVTTNYTPLWTKAVCMVCTNDFSLPSDLDVLCHHLQEQHNIIIDKVQEIADLSKYMDCWKKQIEDGFNIQERLKSVDAQQKEAIGTNQVHLYLLSEDIEEDKQLRLKLHLETLQERLKHQQKEREDDRFSRVCLFCSRHFHFNRSSLLQHMSEYHHFNIGHPDNLVYTNELLTILEEKLTNLQCLYCEKTFKDSFVLKEHMRKKRHRRLRLSNYLYRSFFIVYPETMKISDEQEFDSASDEDHDVDTGDDNDDVEVSEHDIVNGDDEETDESSSIDHDDWNDWVETSESDAVCLLCTHTEKNTDALFTHMKDVHRFDMHQMTSVNKLIYYEQVKLINYIRRQGVKAVLRCYKLEVGNGVAAIHDVVCIQLHNPPCPMLPQVQYSDKFDSRDALLNHLDITDHVSQLPDKTIWNQPQYFFPTYENDGLLCGLVDNEDDCEEVIAEDLPDGVREYRVDSSEQKIHDAHGDQ